MLKSIVSKVMKNSLWILLLASTGSFADIAVTYMPSNTNSSGNSITPYICVVNNDPTQAIATQGVTISYYFYEQNLDLLKLTSRVDWAKIGNDYNAQGKINVSFAPYSGDTTCSLKANVVCRVTFNGNDTLPANGGLMELHFAVFQNNWQHLFNFTDDCPVSRK